MTEGSVSEPVPCPFVYASGKHCKGHITRIEAYKADLCWILKDRSVAVQRERAEIPLPPLLFREKQPRGTTTDPILNR